MSGMAKLSSKTELAGLSVTISTEMDRAKNSIHYELLMRESVLFIRQ